MCAIVVGFLPFGFNRRIWRPFSGHDRTTHAAPGSRRVDELYQKCQAFTNSSTRPPKTNGVAGTSQRGENPHPSGGREDGGASGATCARADTTARIDFRFTTRRTNRCAPDFREQVSGALQVAERDSAKATVCRGCSRKEVELGTLRSGAQA